MSTADQHRNRCVAVDLLRRVRVRLVRAEGQTTTEYAAVLAVIIIGVAGAIGALQPVITFVVERVSEGIASLAL